MTVSIIAAVSQNGVIGRNNALPWAGKYKGDLKRFKEKTAGGTVIMGRKTWESIGSKPLSDRQNVIVSQTIHPLVDPASRFPNISVCTTLTKAIDYAIGDAWIIGGAQIFETALQLGVVDVIDVTVIPEFLSTDDAVMMPMIPLDHFVFEGITSHPYNTELCVETWRRRA